MDPIKEAFDRIKYDISSMKSEIISLKQTISTLESRLHSPDSNIPTIPTQTPTHSYPLVSTPAHSPAHPTLHYLPERQNIAISTGNRGVPTDTSTDRQTDLPTDKQPDFNLQNAQNQEVIRFSKPFNSQKDDFERAKEILDSLDTIKREIRLKFKRLTPQEMQVFSTLYALEEQNFEEITYKILAQRLGLTESSIRDYITKLISKGIPVVKVRQNNKTITLAISKDLQKIATLATIIKLREL